MINDVTLRAFDELVNPVILCETTGKIIYKNSEALRVFPKPIRGGSINTYLLPNDRKRFETGTHFPAFYDFKDELSFSSAFADIVYYERRPVILLFFSHLFLYRPALPLYRLSPADLSALVSGQRLANLATALYTSDSMVRAARERSFHRRMVQVFRKVVDAVLTELAYGRSEVRVVVNYAIDILNYACNKVLSHLGLDVIFQNDYTDGDMLTVDYKPFTLFCANFILFAVEISQGHMIHAHITENEDTTDLQMALKIATADLLSAVPSGSAKAFAELLPGRSLDLYFFDLACKESHYRFSFSRTQKEAYDLTVRLSVPVYRPELVCSHSLITRKDAYALIDSLLPDLLKEALSSES